MKNKIYLFLIFLVLMASIIAYAQAKDIEMELTKDSQKVLADNKIKSITYNMTCFNDNNCLVKIYRDGKPFATVFGNKTSIEETISNKIKSSIILLLKPVPKPIINLSQDGKIIIKDNSKPMNSLDKMIDYLIKLISRITLEKEK